MDKSISESGTPPDILFPALRSLFPDILFCQNFLQHLNPAIDIIRRRQPQYPADQGIDVDVSERRDCQALFDCRAVGVEDGVHFREFGIKAMLSSLPELSFLCQGDPAAVSKIIAVFGQQNEIAQPRIVLAAMIKRKIFNFIYLKMIFF